MTFELEYHSPDDLVNKLRAALLEREEWITVKRLRARYGVDATAMSQRLSRWGALGLHVEALRGETGRIRMLKLTPELRAMMEGMT